MSSYSKKSHWNQFCAKLPDISTYDQLVAHSKHFPVSIKSLIMHVRVLFLVFSPCIVTIVEIQGAVCIIFVVWELSNGTTLKPSHGSRFQGYTKQFRKAKQQKFWRRLIQLRTPIPTSRSISEWAEHTFVFNTTMLSIVHCWPLLSSQYDLREARYYVERLIRLERLHTSILDMDRKTMTEVRRYSKPPPRVHRVIQAALLMLGQDEEATAVSGTPWWLLAIPAWLIQEVA